MSAAELPTWMWGDPARVVERMELSEMGCTLCRNNVVTLLRGCCGEDRNPRQKGWPYVGHRCKWFDEIEAKGTKR